MQLRSGVFEITTGVGTMVIAPQAQRIRVGDAIRWVSDRPTLKIKFAPGEEDAVRLGTDEPQSVQGTAAKTGYFNFVATLWLPDRPPIADVAVLIIDP